MTERPTNRIMAFGGDRPSGSEAYIMRDGVMIGCTWDEFVAEQNKREHRPGVWVTTTTPAGKRTIDWHPQSGSDEFHREKFRDRERGTAKPIANYLNDFGRAAE